MIKKFDDGILLDPFPHLPRVLVILGGYSFLPKDIPEFEEMEIDFDLPSDDLREDVTECGFDILTGSRFLIAFGDSVALRKVLGRFKEKGIKIFRKFGEETYVVS